MSKIDLGRLMTLERSQMKFGVERLYRLFTHGELRRISSTPTLLVGGTNGKGSVCALLDSAFRAHGHKTLLFTSPHLLKPQERLQIQGAPLNDDHWREVLDEVLNRAKKSLPDISFFEAVTAAAFLCFHSVDVAILEVGLGGRLDSTNASSPLLSLITSVGWDHMDILGDTLEKIAFEKAWISRRNRPFLTSPLLPEAEKGVQRAIETTGAIKHCAAQTNESISPHLSKWVKEQALSWQLTFSSNVPTAFAALRLWKSYYDSRLDLALCKRGFLSAHWPGRFDCRQIGERLLIFDALHNRSGAEHFVRVWKESPFYGKELKCYVSFLKDKEAVRIVKTLSEIVKKYVLVEMPSARALKVKEVEESLREESILQDSALEVLEDSSQLKSNLLHSETQTILIAGSIAFIAFVMQQLALEPYPSHVV